MKPTSPIPYLTITTKFQPNCVIGCYVCVMWHCAEAMGSLNGKKDGSSVEDCFYYQCEKDGRHKKGGH